MNYYAFSSNDEMKSFAETIPAGALPVRGEGYENPELMLIKRAPSYADYKGGKALLGQDGLPIRKALFDIGVSFYATNAFPFATAKGKVTVKDARAAAGIIEEEIRRVNPKRVVLFGADAARWCPSFTVPFKKHNDVLGRTFEIGDRIWRVVKAPGTITNVPSAYREFIDDIRKLLAYGEPGEEEETPLRESYKVITSPALAKTLLRNMPRRVALDVETTGLDPYNDRLLTLQVSWMEGVGYAFPWELLTPQEWASYLAGHNYVFQNGTFDVKALAANGVRLNISEDTMLMHSLVDETPGTHSMEAMAVRYLGIEKWSEIVNYEDMESVDLDTLGRYGARDTDLTLRLANAFVPLTAKRPIFEILHRAQNSITRSEIRGVKVDRVAAQDMALEIQGKLHDSEQMLGDVWGLGNANSPKQVLEVLLREGVPLKAKKGSYSTAEDVISVFEEEFPIVGAILNHRHLTKAGSTYLRNLLDWSEADGRYHPEYRLSATETGRLAEKFITLVPRTAMEEGADEGRQYQAKLRSLIIPDEGHVMIGADYSGLELAMAAYLSQDPNLVSDIASGRDTHSILAIQAFNLPVDLEPMETLKARTNEHFSVQRTLAKQLTFGFLFGSSGMSMTKFMSIDDAERLIDTLSRRYPRLIEWQAEIRRQARKGVVETPWGRRRHFYYDEPLGAKVHAAQDRECINFPIQGHSSDMNLVAFTRMEEAGYLTLYPVHDAIYCQAREEDAEHVTKVLKETMEGVIPGNVPFRADVHVGRNWGEV